ncbi:MAG: hypothetical protein L0211_10685 [Planctomycetaceae bacterium]|nr:hypothetical protein [Planctomycetaceae bacterium]
MNIVRCPRCLDDVTVPLRASPKALVRCPLCLEEYLLREALGGLPPELVVLDGSEAAEEPALVGAGVAEAEFEGGDDYRLSGGSFGAALDSSAPGGAVAAPRPVVKGARQEKREKNAVVELLKIVLGGLVGLTLGYFVLLWGFSMDVLDLGPKMAPYAPWIVPAKFRGGPSQTTTASVDTSGDSTPNGGQASGKNGNGKRTRPREPQVMEPVDDGVRGSSASEPASTADPSAADGGLGGITVEPGLKPILLTEPDLGPLLPEVNPKPSSPAAKPQPETSPKAKTKPKTKPKPKTEPKPEPDPEPAPLPTADDLTSAVLAASETYTKVNEATGQPVEVRRQLFIEFYNSASDAGRIISHLEADSPELAEQAATLKTALAGLAEQPGKVSALKSLTDLNLPQRKHDEGVLLAGAVQEFAPAGTLFACKFQAGKSLTETTVVSATDPQETYKSGDELLLVGRVVEDPAKNLPGYEGDAERVVLLGYAVAVPKAETAPNP